MENNVLGDNAAKKKDQEARLRSNNIDTVVKALIELQPEELCSESARVAMEQINKEDDFENEQMKNDTDQFVEEAVKDAIESVMARPHKLSEEPEAIVQQVEDILNKTVGAGQTISRSRASLKNMNVSPVIAAMTNNPDIKSYVTRKEKEMLGKFQNKLEVQHKDAVAKGDTNDNYRMSKDEIKEIATIAVVAASVASVASVATVAETKKTNNIVIFPSQPMGRGGRVDDLKAQHAGLTVAEMLAAQMLGRNDAGAVPAPSQRKNKDQHAFGMQMAPHPTSLGPVA